MQERGFVNPNGFQLNNYTRVETLGKGHCLFAGFSLGLVDLILSDEFDQAGAANQFQDYLRCFSEVAKKQGSPFTWDEYKSLLIRNRAKVNEMQLFLALAQRKLLIHLMDQPPELPAILQNGAVREYEPADLLNKALTQGNHFFQSLVSEFHDFVIKNTQKARKKGAKKREAKQQSGDVFNRCDQIKSKFAELFQKIVEGTTEDIVSLELIHWYCREGFQYFKQHMATVDGWGGPIEVRILAKYWGVTVFTVQHLSARGGARAYFGQPDCVYNANSLSEQQFSALSQQVRNLLIERGLIAREIDADVREILISDEQDIRESLEPIRDSSEILEIWEAFWEQNNHTTPPTHFWQPDVDQSPEILRLLMDRNIINRREKAFYFNFPNNRAGLLQALRGIEDQALIQEMVTLLSRNQNHQRSFVIVNSDGTHWEYYQRVGMPWCELIGKTPEAQEKSNWEANLSDEEPEGNGEEPDLKVAKTEGSAKTKTTTRKGFTGRIAVRRKRQEDEDELEQDNEPADGQKSSPEQTSQPPQSQQPQASATLALVPPPPPMIFHTQVDPAKYQAAMAIVTEATTCLEQLEKYRVNNNISAFMGDISAKYKALNRFFWYVKRAYTIRDAGGDDCALLLEIGNNSELQSLYPVAIAAFIQKHNQDILDAYHASFKLLLFKLGKMFDCCSESYSDLMIHSLDRGTIDILNKMQFHIVLYLKNPQSQYLNDLLSLRRQIMSQCHPHLSKTKVSINAFFGWYQLSFFKRTSTDEFNKLIIGIFDGFETMYTYLDNIVRYLNAQTKNDAVSSTKPNF